MRKRPRGGPRVFDESFKRMAVELSEAKGSVAEAAAELGLHAGRISNGAEVLISPIFEKKLKV